MNGHDGHDGHGENYHDLFLVHWRRGKIQIGCHDHEDHNDSIQSNTWKSPRNAISVV